jgi:hypothetical protein
MKSSAHFLVMIGFLSFFAGCKKQSDGDAIREGINQHLTSLKTINVNAMTVDVTNYSVQGNQAQAQVEFRPKTGGAPGAGMQVSYSLEKQNGVWVVQNTQPMGGSFQHPGPGANPNMMPSGSASDSSPGSMPNFRDLVPGGGNGGAQALPPGHPPINGQSTPKPQ